MGIRFPPLRRYKFAQALEVPIYQLVHDDLASVAPSLVDICESTAEIVFFSSPDGHCDYLNDRFHRYTGLNWRSGEGNGWEAIVQPDDREPHLQRWLLSQSDGDREASA